MPLERARWKAGPFAPHLHHEGASLLCRLLALARMRGMPTSAPPAAKSPEAAVPMARRPRSSKSRVEVIRVPSLSAIDWLLHGFSTRAGGTSKAYRPSQRGGELNLGFTASDDRARVIANRERFLAAITGNPHFPMVTLRQIHSSLLSRVTAGDAALDACAKADGMMTAEPGILLAIQTADCIPVLLADRKRRAVAGFDA